MSKFLVPVNSAGEELPAYMMPLVEEFLATGEPNFSFGAMNNAYYSFLEFCGERGVDYLWERKLSAEDAELLPDVEAKVLLAFDAPLLADTGWSSNLRDKQIRQVLWRAVCLRLGFPYRRYTVNIPDFMKRQLLLIFAFLTPMWFFGAGIVMLVNAAGFVGASGWILGSLSLALGATALSVGGWFVKCWRKVKVFPGAMHKYVIQGLAIANDEKVYVSESWSQIQFAHRVGGYSKVSS